MNDFVASKEIGEKYQDYIQDWFAQKEGIFLCNYGSRYYQMNKGENSFGMEIKHDEHYWETGNVFIEFEAVNKVGDKFIEGGIKKKDNAWLYLIGDESNAFIFAKCQLVSIYECVCSKPQEMKEKYGIRVCEHTDKDTGQITSRGIAIPINVALKKNWIIKWIKFKEGEKDVQ